MLLAPTEPTKNHSAGARANAPDSRVPFVAVIATLALPIALTFPRALAQGEASRESPAVPAPSAPPTGTPGADGASAGQGGTGAAGPDTAPSLVRPDRSGFRGFEDRGFGVGIYRERTQYRTRERYETRSLGAAISYDQHIRGPWTGGLLARWSVWEPQLGAKGGDGTELERVAPLSLYTRMSFTPRLPWLWGRTVDGLVRPFGVAGLGYLAFFEDRPSWRKSDQETSETIFTGGGGVRFVWPGRASLRLSFERWRGLRTFRYSAVVWKSEVQFGDVDAL